MNTKLEMSTKSELNKNNKINAIRVLIAVSFSAFAADRRCTPFYLDKSRKLIPIVLKGICELLRAMKWNQWNQRKNGIQWIC